MNNEKNTPYEKSNEDLAHREQRIRERAHRIWVAEGRPEGRADEYWRRAEELIQDESQSAYPPSASRGDRS
jgi:hypothetical protein